MHDFKEKVVIVTGGASGIGAHIVEEFLKEGVKYIAFLDIAENVGVKLEGKLKITYGENKVCFFKCDVTKDEELFGIYESVQKDFNGIDVVVNNAGIATETPKTFKKTIETNLSATISSTYKALDLMRVDHGGKGGTIINVSSVAALSLLSPSLFTYSATKMAVLHFSNCVGKEEYYRHTNVRVLTICFGITETAIWDKMDVIDELIQDTLNNFKYKKMQSGEVAAQGLMQSYRAGKSGSTWLINYNNVTDISDDIQQGFKVLSGNKTM
ncbi:15-hydroxyprostaglandin dehydrogenase [NAD(+)]-like [Maniola jurtina]|uniref:15-hydroxyprostaglandin dehydrogenase [NAD(+)]-like n=1 Tax=Maniola jurtina TaxID=191418 RepID=UPI001E689CBD|nr:15-hydroxyprostaglandin dehydrogenase [NAD(+)]-like [Maniola jurtina]